MHFIREALCMLVLVVAGTGGEIALTHAMKQIGEVHRFTPRDILNVVVRAFRVGWMWFALSLMTVGFFALLVFLSWENVSFVVPASALSYAAGAFGAKYFLGEKISASRWVGVLLVCVGVAIVWAA
ncbi:MAG: EamA family transporter [Candidatus Acidiferrales bacterium]